MVKLVYLNSKYVKFQNAKIHIEDRGLQFSDSVYEVIPFYNKKLIDLIFHINRLKFSLKELNINYIINFWNGDETLGTSFWAVYTIGGTIVSLPAFVLPETSSAIFIFVPFQFIYLIWAMVGTWRSASKFKPKKKQWSWGTIAQVYIVLSVLRILFRLATALN